MQGCMKAKSTILYLKKVIQNFYNILAVNMLSCFLFLAGLFLIEH